MMTDFLQHKVSRSFAQSFTEFFCGLLKNLALFVLFYTEIHRVFLILIALIRDTPRHFAFSLRTLRKNFAPEASGFAFKSSHCFEFELDIEIVIELDMIMYR